MALRLPTQAPPRRTTSYPHSQPSPALSPSAPAQLPEGNDESTQWVVFSPSQPSTIAPTRTASTERATGISRLSDFESFGGTQTRSAEEQEQEQDNNNIDEQDDDGTELDSLDDGLHAFRAPSLADDEPPTAAQWDQDRQGTPAVLPTHDGLGSFQASSQTVQDKLWQHEQLNPQRRPELRLRRRSSVQRHLDMVAEQEQMTNAERERWQRIEKWRMEQSRLLLQEVERETRRRRRRRNSRASRMSEQTASTQQQGQHCAAPSGSMKSAPETNNGRPSSQASSSGSTESGSDESLWKRITRKVIRDLMGIDDNVLSVIFGESLPDDPLNEELANATELDSYGLDDQNHWQPKLLQRIARELGVLVHQLCEQPGAFSTYLSMSNQIGNEYAGMPLERQRKEDAQIRPLRTRAPSTSLETSNNGGSMPSPHFSPTLPEPSGREHAAQWGIEEDDDRMAGTSESVLQQEKEYWESDLDVMMVFRYLRNRFGGSGNTTNNGSSNSSSATTTAPASTAASRISSHRQTQSQDASRRAAMIRQHHPLVAHAHSRSEAQTRRQSQHSAVHSSGISSPIFRQNFRRRPSSSCASHSAKLSTISSRRTMTGSSRNYWDIGGSVDSGSAIAPVGGAMGAWGDV
ncbi:uncharacterized protein EURHEDRAFT_451814 [Aspergillus ruber CBS 135680]|uniref:Uncharacterized protein n=1 Tax=Aspergillus ruber (strain CBS 135680) TaxID=1388766 RepID=A0A017SJE7_ASPRC|nr:uncharacterized protein EURHEDRAFT_451814 [Aspergillus ruber CBS 135680]EYE97027.1 hypothetical protein EURHEDRAFT_451814 [Aspergillus ruber CBS 135680]